MKLIALECGSIQYQTFTLNCLFEESAFKGTTRLIITCSKAYDIARKSFNCDCL